MGRGRITIRKIFLKKRVRCPYDNPLRRKIRFLSVFPMEKTYLGAPMGI
jgi:hypothetical protein